MLQLQHVCARDTWFKSMSSAPNIHTDIQSLKLEFLHAALVVVDTSTNTLPVTLMATDDRA